MFYNNFAKFLNISYFYNLLLINLLIKWSCGRVARLSSAKAATAVRIRSGPQKKHLKRLVIEIFRAGFQVDTIGETNSTSIPNQKR